MRQQFIALVMLVSFTLHAQSSTPAIVRIRLAGESTPIALPFNQPLSAWTKIYGMGYHNPETPGYGIGWKLHRVSFVTESTGQPRIATRVSIIANDLTLAEATEIARSLGLRNRQADPNMDGTTLWPGDHLSLRYRTEPGIETMIEIWTDQDPRGALPEEE
jgi:hypothetical protein